MSIAAAQYDTFKKQIIKEGKVFTFTEAEEYLVYRVHDKEVIPFWSSRSRLEITQNRLPKYLKYTITELSFKEFYEWLPLLEEEKISIGINWSGRRLIGYDVEAENLLKALDFLLNKK